MNIRVLLVDDNPTVLDRLKRVVDAAEDLMVSGTAADCERAVEMARNPDVDIIVLDVKLPEGKGIEAVQHIHAANPNIRIIAAALYFSKDLTANLQQAGIAGYLKKNCTDEEMVDTIRAVASR